MFERTKHVLVESYVGAIALGYVFAQGILHFVNIFASPVASWASRKQYAAFVPGTTSSPSGFPLEVALPELVRFFLLLLVWYFLLRWLYFSPHREETSELPPNREQASQKTE
jgi:hypothetical protein